MLNFFMTQAKPSYILLSYPLSENTPPFKNNPAPSITIVSNIAAGDQSNMYELKALNHSGTHYGRPVSL